MTSSQVERGELYEFRVRDHLEEGWFHKFAGLTVHNVEDGQVILTGRFESQADVHRVLERIQALNLLLISVMRVE